VERTDGLFEEVEERLSEILQVFERNDWTALALNTRIPRNLRQPQQRMVPRRLVNKSILEDHQQRFSVACGQLRVEHFEERGSGDDTVLFDVGG
jgi:hypothetical protein